MRRFLGGFRPVGWLAPLLLAAVAWTAASAQSAPDPGASSKHLLTIDDVLDTEHIDRATLSPDGAWVAAVVQRGARPGEVYGRAAYETDPSRTDIWLISTRTGERRQLTHGSANAAGYWCATWSPDGQRLALLSTAPQGREPRGGDNVRLYVWDRASGALTRMSDDAIMTQTRYGSGIDKLDLRGGADRGTIAHECSEADEKAPFLWLDDHRMLAVMLPTGQISGLLDQYGRPFRIIARDAVRLRDGSAPTVSAVGSGDAIVAGDAADNSAILRIVDVRTRSLTTIATVPTYPFRGNLGASVSPDGKRVALFVTLGALHPKAGSTFPNSWDDGWTIERRLGFVDLAPNATIRWAAMPAEARYPLELYGWSPDSRSVALRARAEPFATATPLFVSNAATGATRRIGPASVGEALALDIPHPLAVLWADDRRLIARTPAEGKSPASWWLVDTAGTATDLGRTNPKIPDAFARASDGTLIALMGKSVLRLDLAGGGALTAIAQLSGDASLLLPQDVGRPTGRFLIAIHEDKGTTRLATLDSMTGQTGASIAASTADLLDMDFDRGTIIFSQTNESGVFLRQSSIADGKSRDLLALDGFLSRVNWGRRQVIDYKNAAGAALKAIAILPPDYQPGRHYPTLAWVYGGYTVRSLDSDYMSSPSMPGIYNLQLYAARGYVVLIPSMPLETSGDRHDVYAQIPDGVMPAIDRLVALGITDPDRIGVFGQSFGGYSVYALVSQTDRFKAAVAMAGIADLASNYNEFDPTARGYPGIEHEKSDNWQINPWGEPTPPWKDLASYARNSPLTYVDRVKTPLLLIHGSADIRGAQTQAEQFFYSLYAQGKTAKLLRYGGESHSLAQSPANIRDIFAQTIEWFDRYVKGAQGTPPASAER